MKYRYLSLTESRVGYVLRALVPIAAALLVPVLSRVA